VVYRSGQTYYNQCGLTVQTTANKRQILAKLRGGKPVAKEVISDFIFIGSLDNATQEMTDRACRKICDFVRTNVGKKGKIKNMARVWRNGLRMYDASIAVANEDVSKVVDDLICE
jgi:hypothetical protein